MRNVTLRAAADQAQSLRLRVLGIAALALILTGAGQAGNAAAGSFPHDAAREAQAHQAESPNVATPVSETLLSGCLIGSWIHSREEDTAETIVFRPADYHFDPSRGHDGYEFQTGGILVYHGFGPADEPLTSVGEWGWTAPDQIHTTVNDPRGAFIDGTLRVVSCDAETLQVERVVAGNAERRSLSLRRGRHAPQWVQRHLPRHCDGKCHQLQEVCARSTRAALDSTVSIPYAARVN